MRIAQIILAGAPEFERKLQRVDLTSLSSHHEVIVTDTAAHANSAAVAHVYAPRAIPHRALAGLEIPYVAPFEVGRTRFAFRPVEPPRYIVSPLIQPDGDRRVRQLPEAVEEAYFDGAGHDSPSDTESRRQRLIGSYRGSRPRIGNAVEQTLSRIHRFRDDVTWKIFDQPPSPADLTAVDVWVDPAAVEEDWDGFVAEAIAGGKAVVATRTAINSSRLEKGRTGALVPCDDPNELAHAILGALFKPEVARSKIEAAKQTAGKFRPRQRLRLLEQLYEMILTE